MRNERLVEARNKKELSQYGLALAINLKSAAQISLYENYSVLPTRRRAKAISEILQVPVKELWPAIEED